MKNKKTDVRRKFRINHQIRVKNVRLIDPEGKQLGIINTNEARSVARDYGLDLIEVAPQAKPPVCRIADYGKMQYEQSKKEKQQRKVQHKVSKTVQLKPNIGENDLLRKIANIKKFLDKGYRVVVQVTMKGRQRRHSRLAEDQTINRIKDELDEGAVMEKPQYQGGRITVVITSEKKAPPPQPTNAS